MACRYFYKDAWYTQEELLAHPDFNPTSPFLQRQYINNNTDINTDDQINMFSSADASGLFVKYIQFKKTQLYEYNKRLNRIEAARRKKGVTAEQLKALNDEEREIKLQVEGKEELNIKGIKQEIAELEKNADIEAVGYYVHKDIERLKKLANSNNIDDLREAQRLIDFYELAGTFKRSVDNPFFTQEEIFLNDEHGNLTTEYRLSDETMNKFIDWKNQTVQYQNLINKRKEETTVNQINTDPSVIKTYGNKRFTYNELLSSDAGLKDTHWIDMWTMDITQGIFSKNGIIPQVSFSHLSNMIEIESKFSRDIEERVDKIKSKVEGELIKLGYSLRGGGIIGLKGASYQMFKEITKEGNETGGLVQRYVKEYFDAQSKAMNKFSNSFDAARLYEDYGMRSRAFDKAFEELKTWRRNNTIILNVNKVPELTSSTPETEAYKAELVKLLGQRGYDEQVNKQKDLIKRYETERQSTLDTLLILEGKSNYDELSDKGKSSLMNWENNHNPKAGVEDYNAVKGLFVDNRKVNSYMDFNVLIPRKYKTNITTNNGQYVFTDTNQLTGHYSTTFEDIENNDILREFYDIVKEVIDYTRESMPYELQQKIAVNTIPALKQSFAEILADKNIGVLHSLFLAFRHLWEKVRLSFGVVKQSEISYATLDPITGKTNYKVNDQFLTQNARAVRERMDIEKAKFLQAHNVGLKGDDKMKSVRRFTVLSLSNMNTEELILLADYINADISVAEIQSKKLDAIRKITGDTVEIGKYIRDFSLHSVVQSQSFDLAKISKYFANMTAVYRARTQALPVLEIMKGHYEQIKKPKTNNTKRGIYNANHEVFEKDGLRTNGIRQYDDWFERVALDNYGGKHSGIHGANVREVKDDKGNVITKIPGYGKKIFSNEEKKKIKDIDKILSKESDDETQAKLRKIKSEFGKERTATAAFDNLLSWIRTLRLGYNLSSASTNFLEGVTSNMILSSFGEYFDPKEIYYGYSVVKHSFVKNVTFGIATTGLAKRNRKLMDKFSVIMDSKNELQKSSLKTYASKFEWMNPHELNQRVEYINQSPIMIAMLRSMKVKDKAGNEVRLWDAFDNNGHLKDEFRTEDNIANWENLSGQDYLNFKQKLHKAIVLAHGNYHDLRGMMIKTGSAGKALMMFKTWIPMQLYWRFATEQDDIQSGTIGFKGRYWSYGKGTGAVHGAVVGTALFGPIGTLIGGAIGGGLGAAFGTDSGVGLLGETVEASKALVKKVFGMPVNLLAGRQIINTGDKAFESWVGKGEFTAQDAKNLRANVADITMQLAWLALILMAKAMFWDDDDEPDDTRRQAHNILVNRLMSLSSQGAMYVNPVGLGKTIGSNALWQYLQDVGKGFKAANDYVHGRDIILSGANAGESQLGNQLQKLTMPGLFKGQLFGFETQAERVFEESPFHPYFRSEETLDKQDNQRDRAEYKLELEGQYSPDDFEGGKAEMEKTIKKMVDEIYPTPYMLRKKGMTREEYEQTLKEQQE